MILVLAVTSHALSGKEHMRPEALGIVFCCRFLIVKGAVVVVIAGAFLLRPQISAQV